MDEYICVNNNKIYFCINCNRYIIHVKGNFLNNNHCPNCFYPFLHNVFVTEAKIYFNPRKSDTTTIRYVGNN